MFNSNLGLFAAGDAPLVPGKLQATGFDDAHGRYCPRCRREPDPACPYPALRACIDRGWEPPLVSSGVPPPTYNGDHGSIKQYQSTIDTTLERWLTSGVLVPVDEDELRGAAGRDCYVSPLGAVIKESDKTRALLLAGRSIDNAEDMAKANARLAELFASEELPKLLKIKARIITDMRAANTNTGAYPFRTPKLSDLLRLIKPEDFIGVVDVEEYFVSFPLSPAMRFLFCIRVKGELHAFTRCNFGFALSPYYCDTFSALLREWVESRIGPVFVMCDDWAARGSSSAEVEAKLDVIENTGGLCGFTFASDKRRVGQVQTVLGVQIDTRKMTVSFEAIQARAMKLRLEAVLRRLRAGDLKLAQKDRDSIAGELNWYGWPLQAARTRLRSWWRFVKYGKHINLDGQHLLQQDLCWWVDVLEQWAEGRYSGLEYPILNAETLSRDGGARVVVLQSDASGPHGFGYHVGSLAEGNHQRYYAQVWDDDYGFGTSHHGELEALRHFCRTSLQTGTLLVWVTDSQSAAWSINKGRCKEELSLSAMREILELCDKSQVILVALWVPREENLLADHLSHLAHLLTTHSAAGDIRDLRCLQASRGANQESTLPRESV